MKHKNYTMKRNRKISRKNIDRIHLIVFVIIVVLFANHEANRVQQKHTNLARTIHQTEETVSTNTFFSMHAKR